MSTRMGYHRVVGPWQPSAAQQRVLEGIAAGESNPAIAARLGLSFETIKWHVSELLAETGCADRGELAEWWRARQPVAVGGRGRVVAVVLALAALAVAGVVVAAGVVVVAVAPGGGRAQNPAKHPTAAATAAPTASGESAPTPAATPLPADLPDPASSPNGNGPVVYLGQFDGSPGLSLNWPTALAIDAHDNIYAVDAGSSRIVKFDGGGRVVAAWGSKGTGDGQFDFLNNSIGLIQGGIAVDASGAVLVIDGSGTVQRFDGDGRFLGRWPGGGHGSGSGQFDNVHGISKDTEGNLYITDGSYTDDVNNRLQKFSPGGTFLVGWGVRGWGNVQFEQASGVAIAPTGEMYVADQGNHRIQVLDASGHYLREWGTYGTGPGEFHAPTDLALDARGAVYVIDPVLNRVEMFDNQGRFLGEFASSGTGNGRFNRAAGVAIDSYGDIYIVDMLNNRIEKFRPR